MLTVCAFTCLLCLTGWISNINRHFSVPSNLCNDHQSAVDFDPKLDIKSPFREYWSAPIECKVVVRAGKCVMSSQQQIVTITIITSQCISQVKPRAALVGLLISWAQPQFHDSSLFRNTEWISSTEQELPLRIYSINYFYFNCYVLRLNLKMSDMTAPLKWSPSWSWSPP